MNETADFVGYLLMSKLEAIRRTLAGDPSLVWNQRAIRRKHLRSEGWYESVAIQVASKKPIPESEALQQFSARITNVLGEIGPTNSSECYQYAEALRDVVKAATLYYTEPVDDVVAGGITERRIAVTIYPCSVMAENLGIRGAIEIRNYECPSPCPQAGLCTFRVDRKGLYNDMGRGWFR